MNGPTLLSQKTVKNWSLDDVCFFQAIPWAGVKGKDLSESKFGARFFWLILRGINLRLSALWLGTALLQAFALLT